MALVIAVTLSAAGAGVAVARRWDGATRLAEMGLSATLWVILPMVTFFTVARFHYAGEVGAGIAFAYLGLAVALALAYPGRAATRPGADRGGDRVHDGGRAGLGRRRGNSVLTTCS